MINKIIAIGKNTFIETLRQPIYVVILTTSILLFLLSPSISMYTLDEDIKLLREIGLSTLFLTGLFIAIFSATSAVTEELETKTITTVLSKPIPRYIFVLGKFLGVAAAVVIAHYIGTVAMLMTIRHGVLSTASDTHDWTVITAMSVSVLATLSLTAFFNYTYDWNFSATITSLLVFFSTVSLVFLSFIDKQWQYNPQGNQISVFDINASLLLLQAVLILVAIAVMFSTRFNVVLTLLSCVGVFLLGLINGFIFGRYAEQHIWAKIGRMLVPDLQAFWVADAIYEGSAVTYRYLSVTSIYAAIYIVAILMLAIGLFQRRQVG